MSTPHATLVPRHQGIVFALLALVMLATRSHHFGSALHLPDASLAVFFAAGVYLRPRLAFPLLMLEAALVDWYAITLGGVSDYCVTAAYVFLIPTYAVMWWGGRMYARQHRLAWRSLMPLVALLAITGSVAFLVSNGSFYLFSGRFPELGWSEYAQRVGVYYWPYLSKTLAWAGALALAHVLVALVAGTARTAGGSAGER
jgi:hypothetical protein